MPADIIARPAAPPARNLLRIQTLKKRYDVKSSITIRNWMKTADFPRPILIGNLKYWLEHEVEAWIARQPRRAGRMPIEALRARGLTVEAHPAEKRAAQAVATAATGSRSERGRKAGRIGFKRGT